MKTIFQQFALSILLTFTLVSINTASAAYEVDSTAIPFEQLPIKTLQSFNKKVFAHYFTQFPVSIRNSSEETDYYTKEYLSPTGENNKHLGYGGFLRDRPAFRNPRPESDWRTLDIRDEIKTATSMGIDGFTWNILSTNRENYHWTRGITLLEQASALANGFKILLMPDMLAVYKDLSDAETIKLLAADIVFLSKYDSVFRLDDGRLVISPYYTEKRDITFWKNFKQELSTQGIDIALVALFQGWENDVTAYEGQDVLFGVSDWGNRDYEANVKYWYTKTDLAHSKNLLWMMPVSPQDHRPKSQLYNEASNLDLFRVGWDISIKTNADWIQLITWNDYSEHSHIAPSKRNGNVFVDLSAFYTQWFKTGQQPKIVRDVLYYSHRKHHTDASYTQTQTVSFQQKGGTSPKNDIELLAMLAEPGILEIWVENQKVLSKSVESGIHSIKTPTMPGRPKFLLIRNNSTVIELLSKEQIVSAPDYQDFHYSSGSAANSSAVASSLSPAKPPAQLSAQEK